jgi:hypothetical protein
MLDPTPARKPRDAAERERKARNQRAWRERNRAGKKPSAVVGVTISFITLDALIEWGWLREGESEDRHQVGRAISALLEDAATTRKKFP